VGNCLNYEFFDFLIGMNPYLKSIATVAVNNPRSKLPVQRGCCG